MPLLLLHGWPGSVFEFLEIIPRLTDPARFGGDARDAFTVVAPSLPGYGLSFQPGMKRFGVPEMARLRRRADDRRARLQEVRRARRRLGRRRHQPARLRLCRSHDRHPHQSDDGRGPRSRRFSQSDRGGAGLSRRTETMAARGDRLSMDPGHQAADARLCADRFAGRSGGMDRGEIPLLVGLRRHHRERDSARPHAGRHCAVLVHRRDRLIVLALLRPPARLGDPASRATRFPCPPATRNSRAKC